MPSHFPWRAPARTLILSLALAVSGGLALAAGPAEPVIAWSEAQAKAAGVATRMVQADAGSPAQGLVLQGMAQWPAQAIELVSTPVAGVVQKVAVGVGQKLKPGQEAATLFSPELLGWQRELLQAEAQAGLAARRLERDEKLHAEGLIAGVRLDESRANNESAQLAVRERRMALQLAGASAAGKLQPALTLRSAAAGTVLEVLATPGQRLDAGMPVARIARHGRLTIALQATPEQARQLREGDALAVAGCRTPARLLAIVPQVLAGNQSVQLVAELAGAEDCLRANQFVTVTLQPRAAAKAAVSGPAGVALPPEALVHHEGKPYVFLRTPQGYLPTAVELAAQTGAAVTVRSGLKPGDEVVVRGLAALKGAWQGLGAGAQ